MLDCIGEMMFLDKNGNFMWNFSMGLVFDIKGNELFVKGGYSEEDGKNAAGVVGAGYGVNVSKKNNKLVFLFNYNTRNMYSVGVMYDLFRLHF